MTTATIPLAPVTETVHRPRIIRRGRAVTRHLECWQAITTDGVWLLVREESRGTPWLISHQATDTVVDEAGSLRQCRVMIASGHAQAQLERLLAHERGEHAGQRDSWCPRCH